MSMPLDYGWAGTNMFNCFPPTSQALGSLNPLEPHLTSLDGPVVKDEIKHEYGDNYSATSEMYAAGASAVAGGDHTQNPSTADSLSFYTPNLADPYELGMGTLGLLAGAPANPVDDEELKRQKDKIRAHPLYPFLTVLFERCELATSTPRDFSKDPQSRSESAAEAFKDDLMTFIETRKHEEPSYYVPNPELDKLMLNAIQVLRLHLLELEKVHELCDSFCQRYVQNLRDHMPMDVMSEERSGSANTTNPSPALGTHSPAIQPRTYEPQSVPLPESSAMHLHHDASAQSSGFTDLSASNPARSTTTPSAQTPNSSTDSHTPASERFQNVNVSNGADINSPRNGTGPNSAANNSLNSSTGSANNPTSNLLDARSEESPHLTNHLTLSNTTSSQAFEDMLPKDYKVDSESSYGLVELNYSDGYVKYGDEDMKSLMETNDNSNDNEDLPEDFHLASAAKKRGCFPKNATNKLKHWLFQNLTHPYPSEEQKKQLAQETSLTILQVNNWFINARRRIVQPMIDSNNRAGNSTNCQVYRNRRRKNSDSSPCNSPGTCPPTAPPGSAAPGSAGPVSSTAYSPDPAMLVSPASNTYPMFGSGYAGFGAPGFTPQMFMPGMVGAYNMTPGNLTGSWMDFSSNLGSMDN
uniref:Homeobox protein unc-62 n=1 Tax=Bursaphelenchus xylophilus TaxID=6326 RepID=A0A1I7SAU3_BURXY